MKSLLIVSHGSRVKQANDEVFQLVKEISNNAKSQFHSVKLAFLEFAEPTAEEQIENLAQSGVKRIVLFPFFLAAGSHVKVDLPRIIQAAKKRYPKISFELTNHLGGIKSLNSLILDEVNRISNGNE